MEEKELLENLRPEPATSQDIPSIFVFGLVKAGSTLLNRIIQPISVSVGLVNYSLHQKLTRMGYPVNQCPAGFFDLYQPYGYAYTGFRSYDHSFGIPSFASGRSIYLVRDPRDQLTSLYFSEAYSHPPPGASHDDTALQRFNERREKALETGIDDFVMQEAPYIRAQHEIMVEKLGTLDYQLNRYEDVVFDKSSWIDSMVEYLQLEVDQKTRDKILERVDVVPGVERQASHIRRVTPGDHREKLAAATIARLNAELSGILERYGYDA